MRRETISATGLSCDGCERAVESALQTIAGVNRAEADHEDGTVDVVVEDDVSDEELREAIEGAGYEVVA